MRLATAFQRTMALHVVATDDQDGKRKETSDAEQALAAISARLDELDTAVVAGDPTIVIAETAQREDTDLIVVGKRGRSPIQNLLLGSTAEAVCRRSQRPVLLVPTTIEIVPSGSMHDQHLPGSH